MVYDIVFVERSSSEDDRALMQGLMDYAVQQKGQNPIESFTFFIHDENKKMMGGCKGCHLYGCLWIDTLWVDSTLRGQGYGTRLMMAAEVFGKSQGCTFSTVNTMDWEARGFYQKLGYFVEFERHGFAKDSIFYLMRKNYV